MAWFIVAFFKVIHGKRAFIGSCIVQAANPTSAITEAWRLEINPGGEVVIAEIEPSRIISGTCNRLMDKQELIRVGYWGADAPPKRYLNREFRNWIDKKRQELQNAVYTED